MTAQFWIGFGIGWLFILSFCLLVAFWFEIESFLGRKWNKLVWSTVMHLPAAQRRFIRKLKEAGLSAPKARHAKEVANWKLFRGGRRYRLIHEYLMSFVNGEEA